MIPYRILNKLFMRGNKMNNNLKPDLFNKKSSAVVVLLAMRFVLDLQLK